MATVAQQQAMFTGCGICGGVLCPHEICRVCGACPECCPDGERQPGRKKPVADLREEHRLHELAEERRQALKDLEANRCPTCNRQKRPMKAFCKPCFDSLPSDVQQGLNLSFAGGYLPYYRRAKELLSK